MFTDCRNVESATAQIVIEKWDFVWAPLHSATSVKSAPSGHAADFHSRIDGFSASAWQFGYPPTMRTEACLGYFCMGYQSAEIAMTKCDAGQFILARLVGAVSTGHDVAKKELTHRAEVGYCPSCLSYSGAVQTWLI